MNEPIIYECLNYKDYKYLPKLMFAFDEKPRLIIMNNKKQSQTIKLNNYIVNGKLNLINLLPKLEKLADNMKITKLRISLNDALFAKIELHEFKKCSMKLLKRLKVILVPVIERVLDKNRQKELISHYHNDPLEGGHPGSKRLIDKLKNKFYWKNMTKEIRQFVKNCTSCQKNKTFKSNTEKLQITATPEKPFDVIIVDTIGPFIKTHNGNEYAITIICDLTKYIVGIPIPNKRAETIARAVFENFILIFGPFKTMLTDMGTEYNNQILKELLKILKIDYKTSTPYHHETLGTCERSHRTFNEYVRTYIASDKLDWDVWLQYFTYCYNTSPSTTHGYCPFELVFAKNVNKLNFLHNDKIDPVYNLDQFYQEARYRLQIAHQNAKKMIDNQKIYRKEIHDHRSTPQSLEINDLVLLSNEARHKFDPLFNGPFKIIKIEHPNCVIKDENDKEYKIHKNRLKKFNQIFYFRFYKI